MDAWLGVPRFTCVGTVVSAPGVDGPPTHPYLRRVSTDGVVDLLDTYIENRWIVLPNHANNHGTVHGGNVMKWMDEIGAMSATRFAGEDVVTARMDQVNFRRPVPVGDIALADAFVYGAGRTSIRVRVKVHREDPRTAETELTTESYVVYVAIDEDHRPTTVPELSVSTEEGEVLQRDALAGENEPGEE